MLILYTTMWNENLKDKLVNWITKTSNLELDKDKSYEGYFEYDFVSNSLEEFCNILFHEDNGIITIKLIGYKNRIDFNISKKIQNKNNLLSEIQFLFTKIR